MPSTKAAGSLRGARQANKGDFRQRLLDAMHAVIAEHGYPNTTVADVVSRARTSRRTFYEHFVDREACYVELMIQHNAQIIEHIQMTVDADAPWGEQIHQAVDAWIACGEDSPKLALSWIRDAPGLGVSARRLQLKFTEAFVEMLLGLVNTDQLHAAGIGPISRQRAVILLGGLREVTAVTVEKGGKIGDIRAEAVEASMALIGPGR